MNLRHALAAYAIQAAALLISTLLPHVPTPRPQQASCAFCGTPDDHGAWCCDEAMDADRAAWIDA